MLEVGFAPAPGNLSVRKDVDSRWIFLTVVRLGPRKILQLAISCEPPCRTCTTSPGDKSYDAKVVRRRQRSFLGVRLQVVYARLSRSGHEHTSAIHPTERHKLVAKSRQGDALVPSIREMHGRIRLPFESPPCPGVRLTGSIREKAVSGDPPRRHPARSHVTQIRRRTLAITLGPRATSRVSIGVAVREPFAGPLLPGPACSR